MPPFTATDHEVRRKLGIDLFTARAVRLRIEREGVDYFALDWDGARGIVGDSEDKLAAACEALGLSLDTPEEAYEQADLKPSFTRSDDPFRLRLDDPRTLAHLEASTAFWSCLLLVLRVWDAHPSWRSRHVLHYVKQLDPRLGMNLDRLERVAALVMQGRGTVQRAVDSTLPPTKLGYARHRVGVEVLPHGRGRGNAPRHYRLAEAAKLVPVHVPSTWPRDRFSRT